MQGIHAVRARVSEAMMQQAWVWGIGASCLLAGYLVGQSVGPAPIEFPDPAEARGATEMERAVGEALVEPRAFVRSVTLARLFEGLTAENVEGARRAVSVRAGRWDPNDLQIFLTAWVQIDPEAAVREVERWPIESRRNIGLNVVIREWAASGGGIQAASYVQTISDPDTRAKVAGPLVRGWALSGDFQGALNLAHRLWDQDPEGHEDVVDAFARGVLHLAGAQAALDVARQVAAQGEGSFERRMVRVILNLAGREDAAATAATFREIAPREIPDWLLGDLEALVGLWRNTQPQAALEWTLTLGPSEERDAVLRRAMGAWAIRDFDGAWAWFETVRGPFAADTSALGTPDSMFLAGLVRKRARTHPVEAARWVVRIEPGDVRDDMLKRVAHFWSMEDEAAASEWIASLGLGATEEKPLREAAERGVRAASARFGSPKGPASNAREAAPDAS